MRGFSPAVSGRTKVLHNLIANFATRSLDPAVLSVQQDQCIVADAMEAECLVRPRGARIFREQHRASVACSFRSREKLQMPLSASPRLRVKTIPVFHLSPFTLRRRRAKPTPRKTRHRRQRFLLGIFVQVKFLLTGAPRSVAVDSTKSDNANDTSTTS